MSNIEEDAPVNSAGGGAIAAIGVSPPSKPANWGEPGLNKKQMKKHKKDAVMRRDPPNLMHESRTGVFAGNPTFIVPSDMFHKARIEKKKGKHWKTYIGEDEHGQAIRNFDRKHRGKKPIILQDEKTGAMCYARYGKERNIQEAPLITDIKKGQKFHYSTGRKMPDENMKDMLEVGSLENVGSIGDHDIHYFPGTHAYKVRNRNSGKIDAVIQGKNSREAFQKTKTFDIHTTDSTGKGPKMHKVYRKILQSGHATSLVGSSHSEGGQKLWQRLSGEKGVSVHGWLNNRPVNLDPKDPEETHASSKELKDFPDDRATKDAYKVKLVASYHKRKTV